MTRSNANAKSTNPELRDRLKTYRDDGRSNSRVARELGVSSAAVSTYISGKYRGTVDKIEERAENILRTAPLRKLVSTDIFETCVTSAIAGAITTILKTNDFAVIHGPAGIGKTCGAAAFVAANPTAIFVTLWQDCCNAHYIAKEIFKVVKSRAFHKSGQNRTEWIFDRFTGSNRPLLIDNGHRATAAARKWLFDFHEKTGCPVVMFGNPEILVAIDQNDQEFSRVGLRPTNIALELDTIPDIARKMLDQRCPTHTEALLHYAITVASHRGHLRALHKQIKLALEFMGRGERDPKAAFRAAHLQLPRKYPL